MDAWIINSVKLKTGKLGYVDFQVDGINGVFRAANSDGVEFEHALNQVFINYEFFKHVSEVGVSKAFEESVTVSKHENGLEWKETSHPKLHPEFRLGWCTSWYTCPFEGNLPELRSMGDLYSIQTNGTKLMHSWDSNRKPSPVCYFFPALDTPL